MKMSSQKQDEPQPNGWGPRRIRLLISICAMIVASVGFVSLLGWALELPALASLGSNKIPVAPSSAIMFILYAGAIYLRTYLRKSRVSYWAGVSINAVGALIAAVLLVMSLIGMQPEAEHLGLSVVNKPGELQAGHMSPVTALCFLLSSLSYLLSQSSSHNRRWVASIAWWLACCIIATSSTLVLAYLYGTPILYNSALIPPAALTSLAFIALGTALLALAAPHAWPSSARNIESSTQASYTFLLVFVLLAAGIVIAGFLYFRNYEIHHRTDEEHQLSAIADLKVDEIVNWRKERLGDAALFYKNLNFSGLVRRYLQRPDDEETERMLRTWLQHVREGDQYDRVILLDVSGKERVSAPGLLQPISSRMIQRVAEVLRTKQISLEDFYRDEYDGRVYLAVLIPILDERGNGRAIGALALRIDPEQYFYPFLKRWPTPSKTAETVLVRRVGNEALFLNELRFQKNTALNLRGSLDQKDSPAAQAVLGRKGIMEGRNYRGIPVIADVRPVPDSPWFMVSSMAISEVYEPMKDKLWMMVAFVGALLMGAGGGVGLVWRRQLAQFYRVKYEAIDALSASEVNYRRLFEAAKDGILILDAETGTVVDVNPFLVKLLGFSLEAFLGKKVWELGLFKNIVANQDKFAELQKKEYIRYEDMPLETAGGRRIDVEFVSNVYLVNNQKVIQCNIRDITKRKQKEKDLRKLDRILLARSKSSKAMMSAKDEAWYLNEVCRIIVEDCGYALVWIGYAEQDEGRTVRPVAHAGYEEGYLDSMKITWSDTDRGHGPVGSAIRTGKPYVFHNISVNPAFAPWREEAVNRGYEAVIAVPLLAEGKAFGSLNIYSRHRDPFSEDEVQLLGDLASDLSYGIAAIRQRIAQAEAESALRKSEARYRHLFDNMLEGYAYCKLLYVDDAPQDIVFIEVNNVFEKLTGLKDVVGKKVVEIMPGIHESNPELLRILGRVALTGKPERFETYSEYFGGWLDISVYSHEKDHFIAIFDNITERKRSERSLSEKEARLHLLVETIPDLIWLKDADGIYLTCNKMFEKFFGAKESDIVGKTDYDFVNKELADAFRDHDLKAMAEGKPSSTVEWITFASDGHRALMNTIKTPMYDAEGKLLGVLGIGRDITEYQKLEEQLRHAQKLEGIGTLAGGIAHDFNNILSAIIGYGYVTLMKMPKEDRLRRNIEHILESADRAAALTQSLLAFSRKQITNRKPVDLNNILKNVEKFLVRIIGEDVVVRLALAEGALTIFADAGQLEQVFMNLATNARDAMPHGGSFTIETSIIELDNRFVSAHGYGKVGTYAMISATDTGVGMTEETRTKIFDPFFTTKEVGKGTGLGLAMVYGILKQHEGFINVYSEPGKGTTFRTYFPLIKDAAVEEQRIIAAEFPKGGTETVLLAEDDASVRKLTLLVLEQMGYTVIIANDGAEAVTKFMENKDRIQLLLFDIIMPKMNGKEAYEEIRRVMPNVPVLFASGYSPDMLREKALIEKGAAIVYKPISPLNLSKKVREVLDGIKY